LELDELLWGALLEEDGLEEAAELLLAGGLELAAEELLTEGLDVAAEEEFITGTELGAVEELPGRTGSSMLSGSSEEELSSSGSEEL